jgi:AraC-like DNA-binding protein
METILVDSGPDRHILDFRPMGFRDVAVLGHYKYTHVHGPLVRHNHGNMIEICLLESGRQGYVVEGKEYSMTGGDVLMVYPQEKHGSGQSPEDKGALYWLLLHVPKPNQRFLSLSPAQSQSIASQLLQISPRHFKGNAALKKTLRRIFTVFEDDHAPLHVANLQNLLLRFLLDLLTCQAQIKKSGPSPEIQQIQLFIDQHIYEVIQLSELAEAANLSLSRFKMRFKKEIGVPPAQYIARHKIEKSQQLLASGQYSVTDVAMKLGFSSSQYFATVFKRYAGQPPSQIIKIS